MHIERPDYLDNIRSQFRIHDVVALLGPRQCGKTTLSREFSKIYPLQQESYLSPKNATKIGISSKNVHLFDLEDPNDLQALSNPKLVLEPLEGLIIIDEIQRLPGLFPLLRVLVDAKKQRHFLILGSASRDLIQQSSETLAGRIGYIDVHPFSLLETLNSTTLHLRGGFPKAFLAQSDEDAFNWLENYIRTFLERDVPALGFSIPTITLRRFWTMLCHYHGSTFNASDIGRSLGLSDHTMRHYLDILVGTFMMRTLHPWFENIQKRQVKRPKIYFQDSGIFHQLLGVQSPDMLMRHPKVGVSWEGFALEQITRFLQLRPEDCYYWGIHEQAELDLFVFFKGKRLGFEFKFSDTPKLTKSMIQSFNTLNLDYLYAIYPGNKQYLLEEKIEAMPLTHFLNQKLK